MIHKTFNDITADDLQRLVVDRIAENKTLEYKQELPKPSKEGKQKFLEEVTALANTLGGDIIFGIEEAKDENGRRFPKTLCGIADLDEDAVKQRLENWLRDLVDPVLPAHMRTVALDSGNHAFIIRVDQSWNGPHRITNGRAQFFCRNSVGKFPLDTTGIRHAFAASGAIEEKIRHFRDERLAKVLAGETTIRLAQGTRLILHLVPITAFAQGFLLDPRNVYEPFRTRFRESARFNLDGVFIANRLEEADIYIQIFRSAAAEAITVFAADDFGLPGNSLEFQIFDHLFELRKLFNELSIAPPFALLTTLTGVRNQKLLTSNRKVSDRTFDRDILILPEVQIDSLDGEVTNEVQTICDALCQAAGVEKSPNFRDGKWRQSS